jgi:hypothetical protein
VLQVVTLFTATLYPSLTSAVASYIFPSFRAVRLNCSNIVIALATRVLRKLMQARPTLLQLAPCASTRYGERVRLAGASQLLCLAV